MSLATLTGPTAPAVQALLATSPDLARRAVSWKRRFLHALTLLLQARGATSPDKAKALLRSEPDLFALKSPELVSRALSARPPSFLSLLDRLGLRLRSLDFYRKWADALSDRPLAASLDHTRGRLSDRQLEAVLRLDRRLRTPRLLSRLKHPDDAVLVEALVRLIVERCDATPDSVRRSLRATHDDLDDWASEWLRDASFPPPPFAARPEITPITNGEEMRRAGREFRVLRHGAGSEPSTYGTDHPLRSWP